MDLHFFETAGDRWMTALPMAFTIISLVYFWTDIPPLLHTLSVYARTRFSSLITPTASSADITPLPESIP